MQPSKTHVYLTTAMYAFIKLKTHIQGAYQLQSAFSDRYLNKLAKLA